MKEQPTKEQLEKFWNWCGFRIITEPFVNDSGFKGVGSSFVGPNGQSSAFSSPPTDMTYLFPDITLNNLFKYAVPKLMKEGWACRVQSSPLRDNDTGKTIFEWSGYAEVFYIRYDKPLSHKNNHYAINADPALALFWAIYELIKS